MLSCPPHRRSERKARGFCNMRLFGGPLSNISEVPPIGWCLAELYGWVQETRKAGAGGILLFVVCLALTCDSFQTWGCWDPKSRCLHEAGAIVVVTATWASHWSVLLPPTPPPWGLPFCGVIGEIVPWPFSREKTWGRGLLNRCVCDKGWFICLVWTIA